MIRPLCQQSATSRNPEEKAYWPGGTCAVLTGVSRYLKYFVKTYLYFGSVGLAYLFGPKVEPEPKADGEAGGG